jgi:hypothetical protein
MTKTFLRDRDNNKNYVKRQKSPLRTISVLKYKNAVKCCCNHGLLPTSSAHHKNSFAHIEQIIATLNKNLFSLWQVELSSTFFAQPKLILTQRVH